MRFKTSGVLSRVDVSPVLDLYPPLRDEWAALEFSSSGEALDPTTGESRTSFTLLEGRHRTVGARYQAIVEKPLYDLPEDRRAEFDAEWRTIELGREGDAARRELVARREAASVRVGTDEQHLVLTVREDSHRRLVFSVSERDRPWTIDVEVEHDRLPRVTVHGTTDLTAVLQEQEYPKLACRFFGGTAEGSVKIDFGTIDENGRAIRARGRANRFRGGLAVDVRTARSDWTVDARVTLRARGLARPLLWVFRRRIRTAVDGAMASFWERSHDALEGWEREMRHLRALIVEEGGARPFVRRALWDDDFDLGSSTPNSTK